MMLEFVCRRAPTAEPASTRPLRDSLTCAGASREFIVKESDTTASHGPSFIVQWRADTVVSERVVRTLMLGGRGTQGISFVGRACVIDESDP